MKKKKAVNIKLKCWGRNLIEKCIIRGNYKRILDLLKNWILWGWKGKQRSEERKYFEGIDVGEKIRSARRAKEKEKRKKEEIYSEWRWVVWTGMIINL